MRPITDWRWRAFGLLPLAFFIIRWLDYLKWQTPSQMLWSCHFANLLLAVGFFFAQPVILRLGALWAILGLLPWVLDMLNTHIIWPVSWLSHVGGAMVACLALQRIRTHRHTWWQALLWFVGLQQISRWLTAPALNINVAHHGYGPTEQWFNSYWQYWMANTALTALVLWVCQWGLSVCFPPQTQAARAISDSPENSV